jgi:alpha-galactosidase
MKKITILGVAAALLLGSCSTNEISNGDITLRFNGRMQSCVTSNNEATDSFHNDYISADALVAEEVTIDTWTLRSSERHTTPKGEALTLRGEYSQGGYGVEKIQTIIAPEGFDGMLLIETQYVNNGKKALRLKSAEQNRTIVDSDEVVWSFQPTSTSSRANWILPVEDGFYQKNYLGMNNCDYGGGIPFVTLWRRDGGVSVGLVEPVLKTINMPIERVAGREATMKLEREWEDRMHFGVGDTLTMERSFIAVSTGDYFEPLQLFSNYMYTHEGITPSESEPEAFEPVWCAWGYERTFTIEEVVGTLDKVKEVGFKWVDADDGYQIAEGDWETNKRIGGDHRMRYLTREIHKRGLKAKLWWAPIAADPGTKVLSEHPEMKLLTREWVPEYISWWDSFYLSPVNPHTMAYTTDLVKKFIDDWGFDGLKLDGQHMNLCEPDHNEHSGLDYPEQAQERMPEIFKVIYDTARSIKDYAVVQFCPCGCAINFFHTPYMNQAVASDPTSSAQIRMKRKAYAAINPKMAYYADHVELSDGADDFATQLGIGGVLGSKFTWPKNNPNVKVNYLDNDVLVDYLLTPEKEVYYKKWVGLYNEYMLSTGDYLNLYDLGFDVPEGHVIAKDGKMYYAFYAEEWNGEPVELRGLDAEKRYVVTEYTTDEKKSYEIEGSNPYITPSFKLNYLIEVKAL